ncbi:hypothetical protein GCM10009868_25040 [Terrabacter aerolatus]|uniref:Uncharacterized protein n=1 Tax=Terrabacter aerolatus TaxID=422442 RepID=A0A512D1A6_9MICO|nr:hypothetical protein TAE01_20410 [Terrabacter aerolatus]
MRLAVMVCPRSGSLIVAVMAVETGLSTGTASVPALVVAELADELAGALVVAGLVPPGAVGSAVTADSPLQAASATTGATRPTTARRRRRLREAVRGRAGAAAEVFISPPA